jgi:hypothetical protein
MGHVSAMQGTLLRRKLWYQDRREIVNVDQNFLQTDARSLIVLGEAGMGKSTLLLGLKDIEGYSVCTARKLINSPDSAALMGAATTLVIDALDEVSARLDGDSVDLVLRRLVELALPRFILSCRVADWRKATALQGITDFYETAPLELHLEALTREDATMFLADRVGDDRADVAIDHLEQRGLGGLWRNPQTLNLVSEVVAATTPPTSKGALFFEATSRMRSEHREEKADTPLVALAEHEVLDAAGAAFATMILTGKEGISRKAQLAESDTPLAEAAGLPGAGALPQILGSRLFSGLSDDRFGYDHRAIGEFLGARWLARQAVTPRKRRRLLELFNGQSLVPASLRGLHAWLAWHSPSLAEQVIAGDPMGVIEYGDADSLTPSQGRALFQGLRRLSKNNPRFRDWSEYRSGGLVQPELLSEVRDAVAGSDVEFGLRLLVLQALKRSPLVAALTDELTSLLLSTSDTFANRSEAGDRLVESGTPLDWPSVFETLLEQGTDDSVRLVSELMNEIGYDRFGDALLLHMVRAQFDRTERTVGVFFSLERDLPDDRLDVLIDGVADHARARGKPHERREDGAMTDLLYALLARRLTLPALDVATLWSWMEPFDERNGYQRETRQDVARLFEANEALRRALQRHVLLDLPGEKSPWQRNWRMSERSAGLMPTKSDVRALLDSLEEGDDRWRDVVTIAQHGPENGASVRVAAARFAAGDAEATEWLAGLAEHVVPEWQIEQEKRARERREKRDAEWTEHRANFAENVEELRRGDYEYVVNPAKAYLKLFQDMGDEASDGPARLAKWLGPDLRDAALDGFDAFLKLDPPQPSATEIVESHAQGRRWAAGYIIVSGLAERQRTGNGFDDLPDERLMAGLFELRHTRIDDHAGIVGLEALLADQLRRRGAYDSALRQFFEPQLAARLQHVDGLYAFMRGEEDSASAQMLALEWIGRFPHISGEAETEILDRLLGTGEGHETLRSIVRERRASDLGDERRRTWDAVGIIVDFAETLRLLGAGRDIEPELLWHLRARLGDRRHGAQHNQLDVPQLAWAIATFRPLHPAMRRPNTVTTGDTNAWDATNYISALINRLGDNASAEATEALVDLRDASADGYTELIRVAVAEQKRKRVEAEWQSPGLNTVIAAVTDQTPTTAAQFLAVVVEELSVIQAKIRGSDVDWYRDFLVDGRPATEEHCRDTIIKMFGDLPFEAKALPEGQLADSKRCDILCMLGDMVIPIEIKGQWHRDLWTAADRQLDLLYANDHRAGGGIYLVLWFGRAAAKAPKAPPGGVPPPQTASELRDALASLSVSTGDGRTEIIVLDFTRPA